MNLAKVIEIQRAERAEILEDILTSGERRKMIIAGPGTGKTHTFTKLLERLGGENNLATTFTNKLVSELAQKLSTHAQVHTLHAYCRSALGKQRLHLELSPLLTEVVSSDADLLRKSLSQFDARFQNLDDTAPEIEFYLTRSAYYGVGSFHDMVYRLYKLLHNEQLVVPEFDHIVVDEFQDFNKLEVALIDELEKRVKSGGSVLIVGDDDQSIYSDRFASPHYLRTKYLSGIYKQFRLPFCTRCTEVIVEAVRTLRQKALEFGLLTGSVDKRFECYYEEKQADNLRYQNIIEANCTTKAVLCRYIHSEIDAITARSASDVLESHKEGYPTVMIIGRRDYLRDVYNELRSSYPYIIYSEAEERSDVLYAYRHLLRDIDSNYGWRILISNFLDKESQQALLESTLDGLSLSSVLDAEFIAKHTRAISLIKLVIEGKLTSSDPGAFELEAVTGIDFAKIINYFVQKKTEAEHTVDVASPKILLTSFVGSKGLSAGYVFILNMNNGYLPKDPKNIQNTEVSQFLVALTRTRKQCQIVLNKMQFSLKERRQVPLVRSVFLGWIEQYISTKSVDADSLRR